MRRAATRWRLALVGACLLLGGAAGAYLPGHYGGRLTGPLSEEVVTFDPAQAMREAELQVTALLYDALYRRDARGRPTPQLAEALPDCDAEGRTCRIALRSGVILHDGRTLAARDVVTSLGRVRRGPHAYLLAAVQGIAVEKDQVVLRLPRATPDLALALSAPATAIAVASRGGLTGSGPFQLAARRAGALSLKAHATCFAGRPYVEQLELRHFPSASAEAAAYQVGALQLSYHGTAVFGGTPRYRARPVELSSAGAMLHLAVGAASAWLADRRVREALGHAIDRRRLARLVGGGRSLPAEGPVDGGPLADRWTPHGFDRGVARRLLVAAAAGHAELQSLGQGGRARVTLLVDGSRAADRAVATQLVADLDQVGLAVTVESAAASDYAARLARGAFHLALARVVPQLPEPAIALASVFAAAGEGAAARRCVAHGACAASDLARLRRKLSVIPLLRTTVRLDVDARLGGFRRLGAAAVPYADLYWLRR